MHKALRIAALVGLFLSASCRMEPYDDTDSPAGEQSAEAATTVFLVRHAEKPDDGSNDPPLTSLGEARAESLASLLKSVPLTHVHSTETIRTRDTARPVAEEKGLPILSYGGGDLEGFAETLRSTPGIHLVVGHSNTIPELVRHLGGDPHGSIDDAEYDRFYMLTLGDGGKASTVLLRLLHPES